MELMTSKMTAGDFKDTPISKIANDSTYYSTKNNTAFSGLRILQKSRV